MLWSLLLLGYLVFLLGVLYLLVRPIVRGAIYFPTKLQSVRVMIELSGARPGQKIVDIGSGDGRILIGFAKRGIEAHGYEINPILVASSRRAIRLAHVEKLAFVHRKDFWKVNFGEFDTIIIYCMPRFLRDLELKLEREAKPGTAVISNIYPLPTWKPETIKERVYLYWAGERQ